ncbi:MAG: DUF255 domain-containing protein [Lentisphaerae bacterium]|nr:DUF255 domain-containing protein [Lentisphaerota bacterium]
MNGKRGGIACAAATILAVCAAGCARAEEHEVDPADSRAGIAAARPSGPFTVTGGLLPSSNGVRRLEISIIVPEKHYLYADAVRVDAEAATLRPLNAPEPKPKDDPFSGRTVPVYEHDVTLTYALDGPAADPLKVRVAYQGCNETFCFLPATAVLALGAAPAAGPAPPVPAARAESGDGEDWEALLGRFRVGGRAAGYLDAEAFLEFLASAREGGRGGAESLQSAVERSGWIIAFLLVVAGGLALNLTPCVLPMIPINLAIIGAGAQAGSRRRGFLLGGAYGAGMAAVYGALGLVVILTGARFGVLNASPAFNATIAALFLAMAAAMFDVIHLDLSRFQSGGGGGAKKGSPAAAFVMGGVVALLAGACVAPVVVSVLLFAARLYAAGRPAALLLPFLLGIGMALPWPAAGAGLSFLPKPGKWMKYVKQGFGVIILGFAVYYGHLAATLFMSRGAAARERVAESRAEEMKEGWLNSLPDALRLGARRKQAVLIDFWASWCKSCLVMDKTTFREPAVRNAMQPFIKVKYRAEDARDPEVDRVLSYFEVIGLPTYVVLIPVSGP